jgi:phosphoribosyl 1,2-cyclic phosphate phosphodiesterase
MHTPLDYTTLCAELPAHIRPAFDGLVLDFAVD